MKKLLDKKSLHLTRETVRSLSEHELVRAGGAAVGHTVVKGEFTCICATGECAKLNTQADCRINTATKFPVC